jgi:class 3 adenylate cyclase
MLRFLRKLSHIGITADLPAREFKHVVCLNVVVLLVIFIAVQNLALAAGYLPGTEPSFIVFVAHMVCIALVLPLNYLGKHLAARVWFHLSAATFLTLHTAILGTQTLFHFFLPVCVFLAFYTFPPREKYWMYGAIALHSLGFLGAEAFFPSGGFAPGIPPHFLAQEYLFNVIGVLFCALSMGGVGYITLRNAEENLAREHERSESLLRNILPASIAERLKASPDNIADSFDEATILFVDIVGFTRLSEQMPPGDLVKLLNGVFSEMDDLTDKYGLEKIKTIGDAYMVVAGAPDRRRDHAAAMAAMSLEIKERFAKLSKGSTHPIDFRVGIHSGPVIAGVIGKKKFSYDMWGDSVNTAARMEAHGVPGEIQVSAQVQHQLKDQFDFVERGSVEIKGKGAVRTFLLKGRRPAAACA